MVYAQKYVEVGLWVSSAVIALLTVTISQFIFGWDYSQVLVRVSKLEFQLADFAPIAYALVSRLFSIPCVIIE